MKLYLTASGITIKFLFLSFITQFMYTMAINDTFKLEFFYDDKEEWQWFIFLKKILIFSCDEWSVVFWLLYWMSEKNNEKHYNKFFFVFPGKKVNLPNGSLKKKDNWSFSRDIAMKLTRIYVYDGIFYDFKQQTLLSNICFLRI